MKLIVGLGNPGRKYEKTRHNIGFRVASALADKWKIKLNSKAFKSFIGKGEIFGKEVVVSLPQTYMNNSGEAVASLASRKKVELRDLFVISDDVNIPLGTMRIRAKGSSGGHKGLQSIAEALGSGDFSRLRIGIGKEGLKGDLSDYVLSPFDKDELKILDSAIEAAVECCEVWIEEGVESAAHRFNIKNRKE